jgi:hypothetical protein
MARFATDPESKIQDRTAAQPETQNREEGSSIEDQQAATAPDHQDPKPAPSQASVPAPSEAATGSAPRQPKRKRKYTVSERSKASSRANLLRASLDPRGLKYRRTERRRASQYANLVRAAQSPRYARGFKRGTQCLSLRRSLFLAGETREEYEARRALFHRALGPVGERQERLVEAIFEASWRRRRVFRGEWRWEMMGVAMVLGEAAAERDRSGAAGLIEPERAVKLGFDVQSLFVDADVGEEASLLNRRIERLVRVLVETEGGQPFAYQASRRGSEKGYEKQAAAVAGNPLRGRGEIEASLAREPGTVKDPRHWGRRPKQHFPGIDLLSAISRVQHRLSGFDREGRLRARLEGAEGKAVWMKLWAAALGYEPPVSSSGPSASADPAYAGLEALAEVTWERFEMFRRHWEKEDAAVEQVLEDAVALQEGSRESGVGSGESGTDGVRDSVANADSRLPTPVLLTAREVGVLILGALGVTRCAGAVMDAYREMQETYYRLLVNLYGERKELEEIKPQPPTWDQKYGHFMGDFLGALIGEKGGKKEEDGKIHWRGGRKGFQPSGP